MSGYGPPRNLEDDMRYTLEHQELLGKLIDRDRVISLLDQRYRQAVEEILWLRTEIAKLKEQKP